jgi:hypothetical protein
VRHFKKPVTAFWHTVRMRDEHTFALRQIDQARGDFYAIENDLDIIMKQLARLPTRKELAQAALLATLTGAAIVLAGILAFGHL